MHSAEVVSPSGIRIWLNSLVGFARSAILFILSIGLAAACDQPTIPIVDVLYGPNNSDGAWGALASSVEGDGFAGAYLDWEATSK